jgi:hypothetical protein
MEREHCRLFGHPTTTPRIISLRVFEEFSPSFFLAALYAMK